MNVSGAYADELLISLTSDLKPNIGSRGHDHMVVGFTTTCVISAYQH